MSWRCARRATQAVAGVVAVAVVAVVVDIGVAVLRVVRSRLDVVERGSGRRVAEPRPFVESAQIVLTWTTVIGSRLASTARFGAALERMSVAHGDAMDRPATPDDIDRFIAAYDIDVSLLDRDPHDFATVNELFARPLRAGARPVAHVDDPTVAVSPADCRLSCFDGVDETSLLDVKGRAYDVAGLLGGPAVWAEAAPAAAERVRDFYDATVGSGFSTVRCRLAPGDYHRFHWPVEGVWDRDRVLDIPGQYHSVSSRAVAGPVDVLGRNRRSVAIVESEAFGSVAVVLVGAVKVGTIELTAASGAVVKGEEMGQFRYGGSTVVLVFRRDSIRFDAELLANSVAGAETLVEVGSVIGRATRSSGAVA